MERIRHTCPCGAEFHTRSALREHWEDNRETHKVLRSRSKLWNNQELQAWKEQYADQVRWARLEGRPKPAYYPPPVRRGKNDTRFGAFNTEDVEDYSIPETDVQRKRREREQSRSGPVEIEEE